MQLREHRYKGHEIRPSSWKESHRWYVQAYHATTGMRICETDCAQFHTLADAKEWINEKICMLRYGDEGPY